MLQTETADPHLAMVTITDVDVTKDRRIARVYVGTYSGDEDALQEGLAALERAKPYLRGKIAELLRWPFAPELEFRPDRSMQYGQRIDSILAQLEQERIERERAADGSEGKRDSTPDRTSVSDDERTQ